MRMIAKTRFERVLRLKNLEFYQISFNDREDFAYLLFVEQEDFEVSKDELEPIKIFLITHFELDEEAYKDVCTFNDTMFKMKPTRHYFMDDIIYVEKEFDYNYPDGMDEVVVFVQSILDKLGISLKLEKIENKRFNYLSQD